MWTWNWADCERRQRTLFGIQTNIRDMVISKWSEFQLANKRDEEQGNGGCSGEASWKKIVVSIILDGLGEQVPR